MDYKLDLDHALQLADVADTVTMRYFRVQDLHVNTKPDNTPVTEADTATEKQLRQIVTGQFKENFLGEEGGSTGNQGKVWIVDPIDGTKNFMRGMPLWGTLIALTDNGETIAAAVSAPALGRRWWAAKGMGAWTRELDGGFHQIHTSGVDRLEDAFLLSSTPLHSWDKVPGASEKAAQDLLDSAWRYRMPGDMINYMWLAEGACDACFEPYAKQWDIEAPKLIVLEAGGSFWTNASADTPATAERTVVATNGRLEAHVLQALGL